MYQTLLLIISMLATWRAAYMLQNEAGPFAIFYRLQARIARMKDTPGSFADGFNCFYCLSVWVAFPVALIIEHSNPFIFFLYWMAISAGAVFINIVHEKSSE